MVRYSSSGASPLKLLMQPGTTAPLAVRIVMVTSTFLAVFFPVFGKSRSKLKPHLKSKHQTFLLHFSSLQTKIQIVSHDTRLQIAGIHFCTKNPQSRQDVNNKTFFTQHICDRDQIKVFDFISKTRKIGIVVNLFCLSEQKQKKHPTINLDFHCNASTSRLQSLWIEVLEHIRKSFNFFQKVQKDKKKKG
jgi:hypothetical protein